MKTPDSMTSPFSATKGTPNVHLQPRDYLYFENPQEKARREDHLPGGFLVQFLIVAIHAHHLLLAATALLRVEFLPLPACKHTTRHGSSVLAPSMQS